MELEELQKQVDLLTLDNKILSDQVKEILVELHLLKKDLEVQ